MVLIIVPIRPKGGSSMHRKIQLALEIPLQQLNSILLRIDEARYPWEEFAAEVQKHKWSSFDKLHVDHITDLTFSHIAAM